MFKRFITISLITIFYNYMQAAIQPSTKATIQITKERTFGIIKPDAVAAKNSGEIINLIEKNGFNIIGMQKILLTKDQASNFYAAHKSKPFFAGLIEFMTSGPSIILALEKTNAVKEWRELMGATNFENAAPGTLRRMFGSSITKNAVHGSDSLQNANTELKFFFPNLK